MPPPLSYLRSASGPSRAGLQIRLRQRISVSTCPLNTDHDKHQPPTTLATVAVQALFPLRRVSCKGPCATPDPMMTATCRRPQGPAEKRWNLRPAETLRPPAPASLPARPRDELKRRVGRATCGRELRTAVASLPRGRPCASVGGRLVTSGGLCTDQALRHAHYFRWSEVWRLHRHARMEITNGAHKSHRPRPSSETFGALERHAGARGPAEKRWNLRRAETLICSHREPLTSTCKEGA